MAHTKWLLADLRASHPTCCGSPVADLVDRVWGKCQPHDRLASGSIYFLSRDPAVTTTRSPYGYVYDNPLNRTDPSGRDDINTIPASAHYTGPTAWCAVGANTYTIEALPGESPQQSCDRAFPGQTPAELNSCASGGWGSNGENTGGATTPADVNGGQNIADPLQRDEPEPLGLKIGATCLLAIPDLAFFYFDWFIPGVVYFSTVEAPTDTYEWSRR